MNKTVVIKIGTNAILNDENEIDESVIKALSKGIVDIRKNGWNVLLVSSGAVGAAKKEFSAEKLGKITKTEVSQIRSAVGQPMLMKQYRKEFEKYGVPVAQCLVTRSDFASRERQLNMRNILEKMFRGGILPIANENDFLTPEELDFSDNDQLASFFTGMLQADLLILLSNVSGLFTGHPEDADSKKIDVVDEITPKIEECVSKKKSDSGLGGMQSKINAAKLIGQLGIEMVLASSREKEVIQKITSGKKCGTRFRTQHDAKKSGIRVWLAAGATEDGRLTLDCPLEKIFKEKKSGVSILGVGVKKVSGEFLDGDAIGIFSESGEKIGRGVAKISAQEMKESLQKKDIKGKVFVHADCLFLL
jgi:glutamate 5-kinase